MTPRPSRAPSAVALALAALALAACTDGRFEGGPAVDYALDLAGLGGADEAVAAEPVTTSIGPPLLVGYRAVRVALPSTGTRGQARYFVAPDGVEIGMNDGHLTRAIGLGVALQGMYLPDDSPHLTGFVQGARDGAVTDRVADYFVDGTILHDAYRCKLSYIPREGEKGIVAERCRRLFGGPGFDNTYWTEGDRIVCSLQWFHPEADKLQFFETAEQAQTLDLNSEGC